MKTHLNTQYLLLALTMGLNLGCGDAKAMAKKPPRDEAPPQEQKFPSTDRYLQGLELGTKNGERMITQIKRSTIGVQGCEGQPAFEKAVLAVVKAVRPPKPASGEDLDISRGYFKGYSTVFRESLHGARNECDLPPVIAGTLPGTLIGGLLCGAGSVEVLLLDIVEVEPIYSGWSGGIEESRTECTNVAIKITNDCNIGNEEDREKVERILNDQIALGCAD